MYSVIVTEMICKPDTTMKKLDDATALQMARRLNPTFQGGRAAGEGRGEGRGARNLDIGSILDQQPSITLAELKAGEPVVVVGAATEDMSRMRALKLVAGVVFAKKEAIPKELPIALANEKVFVSVRDTSIASPQRLQHARRLRSPDHKPASVAVRAGV